MGREIFPHITPLYHTATHACLSLATTVVAIYETVLTLATQTVVY